MEFINYYPDNRDYSDETGHPFRLGIDSHGTITEAWFVKSESGLLSVMYELDRNIIDVVLTSELHGYRHIQAGYQAGYDPLQLIEIIKSVGHVSVLNESGIFLRREEIDDMSPLNEFRQATGLPHYIKTLFDGALTPKQDKLDGWQKLRI